MLTSRVIPCLLNHDGALVKTIKFKKFNYIGDPLNTVQIFNNLEVDELVFLDITASKNKHEPDYPLISDMAGECFMPLAYGGGVKTIEQMKKIFSLGIEKIIICSEALNNPDFITEAANLFGSQSVVVSIDVKKNLLGKYEICGVSGTKNTKIDPVEFAKKMEIAGAGEILLNSIDQDGMMEGYDLDLINMVSKVITIPLIACGGAGVYKDLGQAVEVGAQAVAAGSLFVYQKKNRAVLVHYPTQEDMIHIFDKENR
jgi:cyclase